jgi:hypothetical protein
MQGKFTATSYSQKFVLDGLSIVLKSPRCIHGFCSFSPVKVNVGPYPDPELLLSGRITLSGLENRFTSTMGLGGCQDMSIHNRKTERVTSSGNAVNICQMSAYSVRFVARALTLTTELFSWCSSVPLRKCRGIRYTFN